MKPFNPKNRRTKTIPPGTLGQLHKGEHESFLESCRKIGLPPDVILNELKHVYRNNPEELKIITEKVNEFFKPFNLSSVNKKDLWIVNKFVDYYLGLPEFQGIIFKGTGNELESNRLSYVKKHLENKITKNLEDRFPDFMNELDSKREPKRKEILEILKKYFK